MKKIIKKIIVILLIVITNSVNSQKFEWARSFGGSSSDQGWSIDVDSHGNTYTTGFFTGTVDFDPGIGVFNLTAVGSGDGFVQKLDSSGNFIWAKSIGGSSSVQGRYLHVDDFDNILVTGRFEGTADFNPDSSVLNLTSKGFFDVFILKLNSNGNFLWAKSFGSSSTSFEYGNGIITDKYGNVYSTGRFMGLTDFDPGTGVFNLTPIGSCAAYIQKLDSMGNFLWVKSVDGTNCDIGWSCSVDTAGNIYTLGSFVGTVDFDPGTGSNLLSSNGGTDIFIQKLDSSGNLLWAKSFGGVGNDWGYSLKLDLFGNIYATGTFWGSVDFDPGTSVYTLSSGGIFIQKLDPLGSFLFAKSFNGYKSHCIDVDESGHIFVAGEFQGTTDFDPGAGSHVLTSRGGIWSDIFIQKLDSIGEFKWVKTYGGVNQDIARSLVLGPFGSLYVVGDYQDTVDFNHGIDSFNLSSNGNTDVFIQKINKCSPTFHSLAVSTCSSSYFWLQSGLSYTSSGIYRDTSINHVGCDSIVTLNLTINNTTTGIDVQTACDSYTWINGVTYTSSNNTATDTLTNAAGCDSVVTLNLTITPISIITSQPVNQTVFVGGNAQFQVTASGTGLTYQWQQNNGTGFTDISSFGIYSGTTTNTLTITGVNASIQQNGYRCKITNSSGCSDTTVAAILYISLTSIEENVVEESFKLFPNPTSSQLNIETSITYSSGIILNALGQTVMQFKNERTLDVSNLKAGSYILLVKGEQNQVLKTEKFNKY
jgi:hypothetical protein